MKRRSIFAAAALLLLAGAVAVGLFSGGSRENGSAAAAESGGTAADGGESVETADAAAVEETEQTSSMQTAAADFFADFLNTLLESDERDYTSEDFAGIDGYIAAKRLVAAREGDKILLDGICAVELKELVIEATEETDDGQTAEVLVSYEYSWGGGSAEETAGVSARYRVVFGRSEGVYQVVDLEELDNVEIQMAKDQIGDAEGEEQYRLIDAYYASQIQNAIAIR